MPVISKMKFLILLFVILFATGCVEDALHIKGSENSIPFDY